MKDKEQLLELRDRALTEFAQVAVGYGNNNTIVKEIVSSITTSTMAIISTIDFCLDDTGKSIETIMEETGAMLNNFVHTDGQATVELGDKSPVLSELKQFKK